VMPPLREIALPEMSFRLFRLETPAGKTRLSPTAGTLSGPPVCFQLSASDQRSSPPWPVQVRVVDGTARASSASSPRGTERGRRGRGGGGGFGAGGAEFGSRRSQWSNIAGYLVPGEVGGSPPRRRGGFGGSLSVPVRAGTAPRGVPSRGTHG